MKTLPIGQPRADNGTPQKVGNRNPDSVRDVPAQSQRKDRAASPQTLLVLKLFAREPERWRYGYELSGETGIPHGTIYNILLRLGRNGYLEDTWLIDEKGQDRPRHGHRLNTEGIRYAARQLSL